MAWLAPFTARLQPWPFQQVVPFDDSTWVEVYHLAASAGPWADNATAFRATAAMQPGANSSIFNLVRPIIDLGP